MTDEGTPETVAATPAATTGISFDTIAKEVATVDEAVMKVLPFITTLTGVIPSAQVATPFLAAAGPLLLVLDNAAKAIAGGDPNAAFQDVLTELEKHLTPGQANSPKLS